MNTLSRQERLARFQTLTKVNGITTGRDVRSLGANIWDHEMPIRLGESRYGIVRR